MPKQSHTPYERIDNHTTSDASENSLAVYTKHPEVKVYRLRWYILTVYCVLAMLQNLIWNTWGPIQTTARAVFHWEDFVIDLMSAWGSITYCVSMVPFAWLMDVKGLRITIIVSAVLQVVGTGLRCIPTDNLSLATGLIHAGQISVGLAGPVGMAMPALLSSTWFPPNQRTTATAISTMAGYSGTAVACLLGPAFVDDVSVIDNVTTDHGKYITFNSHAEQKKYRHQINMFMYVVAAVQFFIFLLIVFYYPAKPRSPPSNSAATGRVDFKNGLKCLFTNKNFLLLATLYGASTGVYGGWCSVLDQNLSEFRLGVDQKLAGWLGFVAVISGSVSGILFSLFADHFSGHLKLLLIMFTAFSFYSILMICYVFNKVIPFSKGAIYVLFGLAGFFLNGTIPFYFELGVEITYPVAEGVTSGVMTFFNNFLQSIFLMVPLANLGSKWMIWATVVTCATSVVSLLFVKEKYNRSNVDKKSIDADLTTNNDQSTIST